MNPILAEKRYMNTSDPKFIGLILLFFVGIAASNTAHASIHKAPIIVSGKQIRQVTNYPIDTYRLFRTSPTGEALPIPFQIDEVNEFGDYILSEGGTIPGETGNGIFDQQDEIAIMGDDVGPIQKPTIWPQGMAPNILFELSLAFPSGQNPVGENSGAVYLGIYFKPAPPISTKRYVVFNRREGEVVTSRYNYQFDLQNYLVVRGVDMYPAKKEAGSKPEKLLDSSTFYMKADLKYFLTVEVNHRSVKSNIEAFKVGPVRSIVRVTFFYTLLKLNFELGMYTEVSFFSNSVVLPAVMYNPLDGPKSLNSGSGFYYGFSLVQNPGDINVQTNMVQYKETGFLDFLKSGTKINPLYWISASAKDRMMYVEINPSAQMQKDGIAPMFYLEKKAAAEIKSRGGENPKPLGKSPVNMGLFFDLTKFTEGEHFMAFRLFFENTYDQKIIESFKTLSQWKIGVTRTPL